MFSHSAVTFGHTYQLHRIDILLPGSQHRGTSDKNIYQCLPAFSSFPFSCPFSTVAMLCHPDKHLETRNGGRGTEESLFSVLHHQSECYQQSTISTGSLNFLNTFVQDCSSVKSTETSNFDTVLPISE